MGYTSKESMVRVDFFKSNGTWYDTCEMDWLHYGKETLIDDAFILSLRAGFITNGRPIYSGMTAVCLQPYHENGYPQMLPDWDSQQTNEERRASTK